MLKGWLPRSRRYSQKPEIVEALRNGRAEVPEISDRQNDIAEGLIVIADLAGGDWPSKARRSLIELFSAKEEENTGVQLLVSCRVAFGESQHRITTKDLLDKLIEEETGTPWAHLWENDLRNGNVRGPAARIAHLLKPFGIKARTIRMPDHSTPRGYLREDFEESWARYCQPSPSTPFKMQQCNKCLDLPMKKPPKTRMQRKILRQDDATELLPMKNEQMLHRCIFFGGRGRRRQ